MKISPLYMVRVRARRCTKRALGLSLASIKINKQLNSFVCERNLFAHKLIFSFIVLIRITTIKHHKQ